MMGHRSIKGLANCFCKYCYGGYIYKHRVKKEYSRLKRRSDKHELNKELKLDVR